MRDDGGRQHRGTLRAARPELAGEAVDGCALAPGGPGRQRHPDRSLPGHPRVTRMGPVPRPDRIGQQPGARGRARPARGAPRSLVVGVQVPVPRRQAHLETGYELAERLAYLRFPAAHAGVGYPQPHDLGRGAEAAQRRGRLRRALFGQLPGRHLVHAGVGGLAVGDGHQPQPDAGGGQHGQQTADAEHLVVRVRGYDHDTRPSAGVEHGELVQQAPGSPLLLRGTWRVDRIGLGVTPVIGPVIGTVCRALGRRHQPLPSRATRRPSSSRSRSA